MTIQACLKRGGQAISFMLEHGISGTIMRSDYDDTFVIAGSDEFSERYWENFSETAYPTLARASCPCNEQ